MGKRGKRDIGFRGPLANFVPSFMCPLLEDAQCNTIPPITDANALPQSNPLSNSNPHSKIYFYSLFVHCSLALFALIFLSIILHFLAPSFSLHFPKLCLAVFPLLPAFCFFFVSFDQTGGRNGRIWANLLPFPLPPPCSVGLLRQTIVLPSMMIVLVWPNNQQQHHLLCPQQFGYRRLFFLSFFPKGPQGRKMVLEECWVT